MHPVHDHVERQHGAVIQHGGVVADSNRHPTAGRDAGGDATDDLELAVHDPTVPATPRPSGYSPPPMIDDETVRHVARLARLRLSPDEEKVMREELSGILEHIDAIRAMDLDGVPPTTHVITLENVVRPDVPVPGLPREEALREAAHATDEGFGVPRMD
jgi:aspartyl-tRNA(Asn)/glutamyl-tRNA(Gln) amidotransferase subunit C